MSWFEDQIRLRHENEENSMNDAYNTVVNSVVGERFSFKASEDSIKSILQYYHYKNIEIPEEMKDNDDRLDYVCRKTGLMYRTVFLTEDWYKDAVGTFIGVVEETGEYVALVPDFFGRYSYYDSAKKKTITINKETKGFLVKEAICFYKPFPNRAIKLFDIVKFGISQMAPIDLVYVLILLSIATLIGLCLPKANYFLYGNVVEEKSISLLLSTIFFILGINISLLVIGEIKNLILGKINIVSGIYVKTAALMRLLSLPANFFRKYSSGEIVQRLDNFEVINNTAISMVLSSALSGIFSLSYITQVLRFAPSLVWPSLLVVVIDIAFSVITTLTQTKISRVQMESSAKNNGMTVATVSGIQKIKLSGSEKRMFARWVNSFSDVIRVTYNPPLFIKINAAISMIISLGGELIMYYLTIKSGVSASEYYAFQTAFGMITVAISSIAGIAIQAASLVPSIEMIKPIMDETPEKDENEKQISNISGSIELDNASFSYPDNDKKIIDDLSLKIRSGEYVAIVGKSGCGKSTLVRLLLGFEKPSMGAIYYDGVDLSKIEKRSLRKRIGTVMQDDKLFSGDIYSNIVICSPQLPLSAAWEAAEMCGMADDIRDMPMGMNTYITEGNGGISGGQRQRLVIARAIAPKPKILIFDEATSALDNITQKKIAESLDSLKCTRIVIAHRLSTVKHCDRILVMDGGKIIEQGTYDELVSLNGFFAELVERQRLDK